ncbi:MAG TPA: hypothetical protein VF950_24755 [Planctomycetota bacterium]
MKHALMLCLAAAGGALAWGQDPAPLTPEEFTSIHAQLRAKEKWESVPWKTDLHDARETAIQQKKPIFIWAMDGQTLGCT